MLKVFIGYDHRQPVLVSTLSYSIHKYASRPVSITPIILPQLYNICGFKRYGLTPFTFSRFLVPYLCNYEGWGLFLDADILLRDDICKLFDMANDKYAVMVSRNKIEYEWASVMLFNNSKCKNLTPEYVGDDKTHGLHILNWAKPEEIGDLPSEWNHLVGYDEPRPDAKLVHYTQASPANEEAMNCEYAVAWRDAFEEMNSSASWYDLMGNSKHAQEYDGIRAPKFMKEDELKAYVAYKKAQLGEKITPVIEIAS